MTGRDRRQQPSPPRVGRPPAYIAEMWVSARLRGRIPRVLAGDRANHTQACEPDALPQPEMEAEP